MNNKKIISNLKKCPICKSIKNTKIYGFDSFEGLKEDWMGNKNSAGSMVNTKPLLKYLMKMNIGI